MSETIRGTFEGFTTKSGTAKTGKAFTLYTLMVDGKKYGFGFNPPKAAVGDVVTFNADTNDRGYLEADPKSFKTTGETKPVAQASAANSGSASNNDPKQTSIETQSSISAASRIVAAQISAGVNVANPASAVASLVQSFMDILHPKPKAKPKAPPAEPDVGDGDDLPY